MSSKLILFLASSFFFIQFVFFSFLVHKNLFTTFDFNTTVHLQDKISRGWDKEFSFLSDIGKFEITTIVLVIILLISRKFIAGFVALALYTGFHLVELFGKFFVDHPPPPQFMLRTEQIINFPQFHVRSESSFPSGHSGRAIFLSVIILTLLWQSKRFSTNIKFIVTAIVLGYDISMLVSRVVLGEHWSSDVIGGSLLGAACGLFAAIFLIPKSHHLDKKKKSLFPKYKLELKRVEE